MSSCRLGWGTHLKHNVRDVETCQEHIVLVSLEAEVLLETRQTGVADVGSVDKAPEVQHGNSRDDIQVNLAYETALSLGVEVDERMTWRLVIDLVVRWMGEQSRLKLTVKVRRRVSSSSGVDDVLLMCYRNGSLLVVLVPLRHSVLGSRGVVCGHRLESR